MLKDKVIILTGAAGGIGSGTARMLAKNGAKLMLCDINQTKLEALQSEIQASGASCEIFLGDVTDFDQMQDMAQKTNEIFGRIDVLVNNAGGSGALIGKISQFEDAELDTIRFVMELNVFGTIHCTKAVLPYMKAQMQGKIINFSSIAGVAGLATRVDYSAAKGAILSFTKALAMEVGKYNISVNSISPGMIARREKEENAPPHAPGSTYMGPCGAGGYPEDVAAAVVFFASDGANYITGENLLVDGGRTLGPRG